jgi:hypothetical protein
MIKKTIYLIKSIIILDTCGRKCDTLVKLFGLTIVIKLIEISHPNMTPCDCSATFDDVITLKLKKIYN